MSSAAYEGLFQELAAVLDIINEVNASQSSTEVRRKLVQTTNTFRNGMLLAKEAASNLEGGEYSLKDQEDLIQTLEKLKARKKSTLAEFSEEMNRVSSLADADTEPANLNMEVDSTASTPATHK